ENISWSSTFESTGGTLGWFTGNIVFESAEFSNKYIRTFFGLDAQAHGIVTLETFMKFSGYIFMLTTTLVLFFKKENEVNEDLNENIPSSIGETYKLAFKIALLPSIMKLMFVLLTLRIAFSIESRSILKLIDADVSKEKLGLLDVPLAPIQALLPFLIRKKITNSNPFEHFAKTYCLRLILIIVFCAWVYLAPFLKDENQKFPLSFFLICFLLQALQSVVLYSMHLPIKYCKYENISFGTNDSLSAFEKIYYLKSKNECSSKSSITECNESGGICETYLDAYYFQTIICFMFGLIWLIWLKKYLYDLQELPASAWKINLNKIKSK
ncbi:unnamed protein product, partial [Brachionus calyciflorus]